MSNKTIAQCLRVVKSLKGRVAELSARAVSVARWEEGKAPAFRYEDVVADLQKAREEMVRLEAGIARANAVTAIECKGCKLWLAEAIRRLQELKGEIVWTERLPVGPAEEERDDYDYDEATGRNVRRRQVKKFLVAVSEPERVARVEKLRAEFQELNDAVETANHRIVVDLDPPA